MKYLLSTGQSTEKIEYYVIDLFKLYLHIWPNDIPNAQSIGFDFIMTDVKKAEVVDTITDRVNKLVSKIGNMFSGSVNINTESIELIDETKVKITINVNQIKSEEILIDINETIE